MSDLVTTALAAWRVAHMVAREEGPAALFERLRETTDDDTTLGRGLRCPLCVGFWAALLLAALGRVGGAAGRGLLFALAAAGAQAALQIWLDNQETIIEVG